MANLNHLQARYFEDAYCTQFEALITHVEINPTCGYSILLDNSYFYPTGGGQKHDTGAIGKSQIIDIFRDETTGYVIHVVDNELPLGNVSCIINWEPRFRNMQHHTAQHLLSQCAQKILSLNTVSANINAYTPSTIDLTTTRLLQSSELNEIEEFANQIIYENRQVKTYFVETDQLANIPLRRAPKVADDIRIVEIDGFDYSACGGTHCAQTGAIGVLKIIKNERINNKTRIHFTAGYQALAQFCEYHETLTNLSTQLSVSPIDLYPAMLQLIQNQREVKKEIQSLRQQNITYEANRLLADSEIYNNIHLIISISQNRPVSEIRMLAELTKNFPYAISVLITYSNNRLSLMVTSTYNIQNSAKNILFQLLTYINGKGGGDHQIAQGGGSYSEYDLHKLLTDGIQSVRQLLE